VRILCTKLFLAAFSSYVLALAKNSYEKRARLTMVKLTPDYFLFTRYSNIMSISRLKQSVYQPFGHRVLVEGKD